MISIGINPISVNALYTGKRHLTKKGKEMKEHYVGCIDNQWNKKIISDLVSVTFNFHFTDNRRHDIDGPLKALLDSMTGIVYEDDSQVDELHVFKFRNTKEARVDIFIAKL